MLHQQVNPSKKLLAGFVAGAALAAGLGTTLAGLVAPSAVNLAAQWQEQGQGQMQASIGTIAK